MSEPQETTDNAAGTVPQAQPADTTPNLEGLPVAGYKKQSLNAVALVNHHKMMEERVLRQLDSLKNDSGIDQRWLAIARTSMEQGFMALNRAVFQPTRVSLTEDGPDAQNR